MGQKALLLGQFNTEVATQLLSFGNSLSRLQDDVVVFMARSSLCLYDILVRIGIRPCEQIIVSDRVFDSSLEFFQGKRVALVDDTLILGTTLARSKRLLEDVAGATVTTHVFCIDRAWWCSDLIEPDSVCLELDDEQVMQFCAGEVRAMSLLPRPYLVDFPISEPIRLRDEDLPTLLSSISWTSRDVGSTLQRKYGVSAYSFFPDEAVLEAWQKHLPAGFIDMLDIIKVRSYSRRVDDLIWTRIVPIVTLRPMQKRSVMRLLDWLLSAVASTSNTDLARIYSSCNTPTNRVRLSQYILGVAVGKCFLETLTNLSGRQCDYSFSQQECERIFGPWHGEELKAIIEFSGFEALRNYSSRSSHSPVDSPQFLGASSLEWIRDTIDSTWSGDEDVGELSTRDKGDVRSLVSDVSDIFLTLHKRYELAARKETRELGKKILTATAAEAPNRDRLKIGLPWPSLLNRLSERYGVPNRREAANLFSLVLDVCNDLGVSVPIICESDDLVYRAYRHGENVQYTEQDDRLSWEVLQGVISGSRRKDIPHLIAEKSLVLLMRIGPAFDFMTPIFGQSGDEGIVRIDFDLKGAVSIYSKKSSDRRDQDIWLTRRLLRRGILKKPGDGGPYLLGEKPGGHASKPGALKSAFELGYLLGELLSNKSSASGKAGPLDDRSLILLATCINPRSTAAALQAELNIFCDWYEDDGRQLFRSIEWGELTSIQGGLQVLKRSRGWEALHSAQLKFRGYKTDEPRKIVAQCRDYLDTELCDTLRSRTWSSYWDAVSVGEPAGEARLFDTWIEKAAISSWELFECLAVAEISLESGLLALSEKSNRGLSGYRTVRDYNTRMSDVGLERSTLVRKLEARLNSVSPAPFNLDRSKKALEYIVTVLDDRLNRCRTLVENIEIAIREFERQTGRHDFSYLAWYDIIDSTATGVESVGGDTPEHRRRVALFKDRVNEILHRLQIVAGKKGCSIYCVGGDSHSKNDEKHIYFSGQRSQRYVLNVLDALLESANALNIFLRIILVPTGFVGSRAYRWRNEVEVSGERFLEHLSRLKKACRAIEDERAHRSEGSFVAVADKRFFRSLRSGLTMYRFIEREVETAIEGLCRRTVVNLTTVYGLRSRTMT